MDAGTLFATALLLLLYFLPALIAIARHNRRLAVFVLNLLLGWTVIGWFVALGLAFWGRPARVNVGGAPSEPPNNVAYTRQFLKAALDRGVLNSRVYRLLLDELEGQDLLPRTGEEAPLAEPSLVSATLPTLATAPAAQRPPGPALAEPIPVGPASTVPTAPVAAARRPAAWSPWLARLARARAIVRSDFAVNGLAYLGVLLTFTGTLGFVLFAYSSVDNQWLRALGPLAVPLFLGITSWWLYRRGSVLVSVSLELLGAALVPVLLSAAISTAFQDGAQIALRTAMALVLAAIYAAAVGRRPASPLKYLVAPMLWMAVWTAGLAFRDNHYSPAQVALTAAAIMVTVIATWRWPAQRFAAPTRIAALAGSAAVYVLSILFAVSEGGPPLPIFVTGVAVLVTVELLGLESRQALRLSLLQSLLLVVTLAAAGQSWSLGVVGLLAAAGYLAILEWQELRRPQLYPALTASTGAIIGLVLSLGEPWPAILAGGLFAAWVHARRLRPLPSMRKLPARETAIALMAGAAAVPLAFVSGLWRVVPPGRALLILAALLLALTVAVRRWRPGDLFYAGWLPSAGVALAIATLVARGSVSDGELAATVALIGIALAVAPRWPIARVWSSVPTFIWASILLFDAIKLDAGSRPIAWSIAALAAIAIASTRVSPAAAHLALAGYAGSAAALYLSNSGAPRVVTLTAWVAAWLVGVIAQELGRSPLLMLTQWAARWIRVPDRIVTLLPPLVFVVSAPFLVAEAGAFVGVLTTTHRSWTGIALGLTAIGYSAAARLTAGRTPLAAVLATASVLLSGIAIAVAAPDLEPSILTIVGSLAVVGIMGGALRRPFMSWFAWTMAIVLSLLLALKAGVATGSLHLVLIGSGAVLLVLGLLYDELRAGRRQPGAGLRVAWLAPPAGLGALAIPVGLAFGFTETPSVYGWWSVAAATLYLLVAVLLRTGAVSGASYALATFGVASLSPWQPLDHPALLLPFVLALVMTSFALSRLPASSDPWVRWDLPPLVVALATAGLALGRTVDADSVALTWAGLGALSLLVFAWRRHWAWAAAGAGLILVGAQAAGPGWFALALGAVAAGAVVSASRTAGALRAGLQLLSVVAAAGAWVETLIWVQRSSDQQIALTAIASAAIALAIAVMVRRLRLRRDWVWSWGALATVGLLIASVLAPPEVVGSRTASLVAAGCLLVYAIAAAALDTPLDWPLLRSLSAWLAVAALSLAWVETIIGSGWTAGQATALTAVLAGMVAALLAVLLRAHRLSADWLHPSAGASGLALIVCGLFSAYLATVVDPDQPLAALGADQRLAALGVAIGAALVAIATASVARLLWWPYLPWVTIFAAAWSWVEVSTAAGWSVDQGVAFAALAAGAVALATGILTRTTHLPQPWIFSLASLATVGLGGAIVTGATVGHERHPYVLAVAAGLALYASGAALAAQALGRSWLREAAAALAVASLATALDDWQPAVEQWVTIAVGAALASLVASLGIWRSRPTSEWLRPLAVSASLASAGAIVLALAAWPNRGPLIITLLVIGAEATAVGLTLRHPTPLYAAPVVVCAAWLLFATDALRGNPNWLTSPIGLAILATVELARWNRRIAEPKGHAMVIGNGLLVLEYTGMAFLVGAALVQTVFVSVWYGLLGVALGVALVGWAAFTRVRRRTEVGGGVVLLSLFLMLTVPVVRVIPEFRGIALWISVAAIGVLLLVVATTIEQSRARVMAGIQRLDRLMAGWE